MSVMINQVFTNYLVKKHNFTSFIFNLQNVKFSIKGIHCSKLDGAGLASPCTLHEEQTIYRYAVVDSQSGLVFWLGFECEIFDTSL